MKNQQSPTNLNPLDEPIQQELDFCTELGLEKNEHGHYLYTSQNGKSSMNLPFILQEYREWLLEKENG